MTAFGEYVEDGTASTLKMRDYKDATDLVATTQYGPVAGSLTARHDSSPCADRGQNVVAIHDMATRHAGTNGSGADVGKGHGLGVSKPNDPMFTLTKGDVHAVAFGVSESPEVAHCLRSGASKADKHESTTYVAAPCSAFRTSGNCGVYETGDKTDALTTGTDRTSTILQTPYAVRRLTPTECERLQGFPDGHSMIPWRNKPADQCPDGPRYKALGNSMAVPVMHWIGKRIQLITDLCNSKLN